MHYIWSHSTPPEACSKSHTNVLQTKQRPHPQQSNNDHAINTQSALLRVEWVQWDSRTINRKRRDKCHMPDMGKPGKLSSKMKNFDQHLQHTRQNKWTSTFLTLPTTIHFAVKNWCMETMIWNMTRPNKTASRNVQRAHTLCNGIGGGTPNVTER